VLRLQLILGLDSQFDPKEYPVKGTPRLDPVAEWGVSLAALGMLSSSQHTDAVNLDELSACLRKMSEADLIAFGKSVRYMCSPVANLGHPPCEPFVVQLRDAEAEWRRRQALKEGGS
jgi:hypothetical protein